MSMLGMQADALRKTADMAANLDDFERVSVPWMRNKLAPMLREAADTIEGLRDRLQAVGETCEDVSTKNGIFKCSECGCTVEEDGVDWGEIHYCPDCGKWAKR